MLSLKIWNFKDSEKVRNLQQDVSHFEAPLKNMAASNQLYIWDRHNQVEVEPVLYNKAAVQTFHQNILGRWIYRFVLSRPIISQLLALRDFTRWSRKKIPGFITTYGLDPKAFVLPIEKFQTFNDFFIRELRPGCIPFDSRSDILCSPCEAQLEIVRCLNSKDTFTVKGVTFSLENIVGDRELAERFIGGDLCSFYLAPQYYHRFHFPIDCQWRQHRVLGKRLFAVNDFSFRYGFRPFDVNIRHVNLLWNSGCQEFLYIEVGATLVGSIQQCHKLPNRHGESVSLSEKKGDQKGFFSLGGSSILMVFSKDKVVFSKDILEKNQEDMAVWVRPGEDIGRVSG